MPSTVSRLAALALALVLIQPVAAPAGAIASETPMLSARVKKISSLAMTKWGNVLNRVWANQPLAAQACNRRIGGDCRLVQWSGFIRDSRGVSRREQIRRVQSYINRNAYREDIAVWGQSDYWAAPGEFFARGGDCEDFAIAKYMSLKQLGFEARDMRVLVLRDTRRQLMHAVLLVQDGGDTLVLDNNAARVLTWDEVPHYKPLYSVNEIDFWLHRNADNV